jgi:hypothetical protein
MKKDFITVTPDNGTGDRTITVQADSNSLLESRSSSLTIGASGISKPISVNQHGSVKVFAYILDANGDYLSANVIVNGANMNNQKPAYVDKNKKLNFEIEPMGLNQRLAINFEPDQQWLSAQSSSSDWEVLLKTQHDITESIIIKSIVSAPKNTVVNVVVNNMGSITLNVTQSLKKN